MRLSALLLLIVALPSNSSMADSIPAALSHEGRYRLIFVTSTTRDGLSSNIEEYNDFVQTVADESDLVGPLGLEWKALVSTEAVDARDNTETNPEVHELVPIYMLNGTSAVLGEMGPEHLFIYEGEPSFVRPINITEHGTSIEGPKIGDFDGRPVHTGTNGFGVADYSGNSSPLGGPTRSTSAGDTNWSGMDAFDHLGFRMNVPAHFYAISEIFSVPEPSAITLGIISLFSLSVLRKKCF